jgi:hypothetical protein
MSLTRGFKEFLQSLNDHGVEYLVVGGHAVAYHGNPRATADLDVWVAVHPENATRVVSALRQCGFDLPEQGSGRPRPAALIPLSRKVIGYSGVIVPRPLQSAGDGTVPVQTFSSPRLMTRPEALGSISRTVRPGVAETMSFCLRGIPAARRSSRESTIRLD